jgi:hypothetical protein
MIDNTEPFPVFWTKYHINELKSRMKIQYISENQYPVIESGETASLVDLVEDTNL